MKKRILPLAVCAVTILVIYSCGIRWDTTKLNNTICLYYPDDISQLPVSLVHDMVNTYKDNQLNKINTEMTLDDAHSIWFDFETLKAFIYHIENEAKKNTAHPTSSQDLGIRIYYASYPSINNWSDFRYKSSLDIFRNPLTELYAKRHTLVMVPTLKRNGLNIDFNPLDSVTYVQSMKSLPEKYGPDGVTDIVAMSGTANQRSAPSPSSSSSLNHGSLIPPGDPLNLSEAFGNY